MTLLFTDIEGSTKLLDELGDAYAGLLAEHRRVLRDVFDRHGGVEVDTQGDAFFVAFPTVSGALSAAFETQTALSGGQISVRVGVHTGEPTVTEDGYVGMDVHRGARIAAAGHGGQVLISQATYDLAGQGSPLIDLGEHRLKDLSAPLHLWQLGEGDFPPLRTLHQTNLPVQVTPLIGRERELSELRGLLNRQRLVTLTGAGGSGKTRLALHLAAESVEDNPDGVWWVPLAALSDPELVLLTVAQTLGVPGDLASHLRSKRLLLLLDNLEHVIECAPQLAELLASVNGVRLLVTSREPMRIEGEHLYAVEPLAEDAAVMLFVERAAVAEPREAVREICRRLDCLPLAVEFLFDDAPGIAIMLPRVATEAARAGDLVQARGLAEEGLIRNRQRGSRRGEAEALATLGRIVWGCGEHETALQLMEESLAAAREANFAWWEANTLVDLAECALELGAPLGRSAVDR